MVENTLHIVAKYFCGLPIKWPSSKLGRLGLLEGDTRQVL